MCQLYIVQVPFVQHRDSSCTLYRCEFGYIAIYASGNTLILKYVSILKYLDDLNSDYMIVVKYTQIF